MEERVKFLGAMLIGAAVAMPAQTSDVAIDNFKCSLHPQMTGQIAVNR
jgi:hypothetical protein